MQVEKQSAQRLLLPVQDNKPSELALLPFALSDSIDFRFTEAIVSSKQHSRRKEGSDVEISITR